MKRKIIRTTSGLAVIMLSVLFILNRAPVADAIKNALTVIGEVLIPSMFPFMIVSSFASSAGVFFTNGKTVKNVMSRLFHLPACAVTAVIFGFTGGYPVGAKTIRTLYEKGQISHDEAYRLFAFCVNAGPAFVVSSVGGMMLGSRSAGYILLASVCIGSLFVGIFTGFMRRRLPISENASGNTVYNIGDALVSSVRSSTEGMLSVCGWYLLFSAVLSLLRHYLGNIAVIGIFAEVTDGSVVAASLGGLPLCAAALSFGGISVMCQLLPDIKKCGIKAMEYLSFRIINSVISYCVCKILISLLHPDMPTTRVIFSSEAAPASAALIIMSGIFILELSSGRNAGDRFSDMLG